MPTISLAQTSDTVGLVWDAFFGVWTYNLPRDLFTGTFTDTGSKGNVTHRQTYWPTVATPFSRVNNGKPAQLLRGDRDCAPGPSSPQYAQPVSVAWGVVDVGAVDGHYDNHTSDPSGTFYVQCRWCDFDDISAITDTATFMAEAHAKWVQVDGLKYFNAGSTYNGPRPTHGYPITGDLPTWYDADPTHLAGERGRLAPFVPAELAAGWHVNPNDPTTPQTARVINGERCTPCYPHLSAAGVPYISADSAYLYLGSDAWLNGGQSDYYIIERLSVYSEVYDSYYLALRAYAFLPFHRGTLPNVDLRLYGDGYFATDGYIRVLATCYPSGTQVVVWTETVVSVGLDFTRSNLVLSLTAIPAGTVVVRLTVDATGDFGAVGTLDVAICKPLHMYGVNPVQTTDWPEVVPGVVRRVAL